MKKVVIRFIATLILVCCPLLFAAPTEPPQRTKTSTETKLAQPNAGQSEEVAVLKSQVATMKEFNQHILTTVFWALGSIVVVAALLVGFGWFTNHKLHERELASLRQEITNAIESRVSKFTDEFSRNSQSSIKQQTEQAAETNKRKINEAINAIQEQINDGMDAISDLRFSALESEARYWELRGIKANVLDRYRAMLELAIERKNDNEIASAIDGLKKLILEGTPLFHISVNSIVGMLDILPSKFSTQSDALRDALKRAKTY